MPNLEYAIASLGSSTIACLKNSTASEYFADARLAMAFSKELAEARAVGGYVGGSSTLSETFSLIALSLTGTIAGVFPIAERSATVVGWLTDSFDVSTALDFGSGCRANSYVITPNAVAGSLEKLPGENRALRAAFSAASRSSGLPETGRALITIPFSSMPNWTSTLPCTRAIVAATGYSGSGSSRAAFRSASSVTWIAGNFRSSLGVASKLATPGVSAFAVFGAVSTGSMTRVSSLVTGLSSPSFGFGLASGVSGFRGVLSMVAFVLFAAGPLTEAAANLATDWP